MLNTLTQTEPNSDISYNISKYNFCCAGKNCINILIHHIKLIIIKKSGWFCDSCKQYLQKEELIESIIHEKVENGDENQDGKL